MKSNLAKLPCLSFENQHWLPGEPLAWRRISLISAAGLQRRGDRPFEGAAGDYRVILVDLKAFYFEAAIAMPGSVSPTSGEFNRWFWKETPGGRFLKALKERFLKGVDDSLGKTGAKLLIPLDQD